MMIERRRAGEPGRLFLWPRDGGVGFSPSVSLR